MADYTITAASVVPSSQAIFNKNYLAGETLARGKNAYLDTTLATPNWRLLDANAASAGTALAAQRGVVCADVAVGQPADICVRDPAFAHGLATVAAGDVIIASTTAGASAPIGDLASSSYLIVMGLAVSATVMNLNPLATGTVK